LLESRAAAHRSSEIGDQAIGRARLGDADGITEPLARDADRHIGRCGELGAELGSAGDAHLLLTEREGAAVVDRRVVFFFTVTPEPVELLEREADAVHADVAAAAGRCRHVDLQALTRADALCDLRQRGVDVGGRGIGRGAEQSREHRPTPQRG
jgi:hypothetical protein